MLEEMKRWCLWQNLSHSVRQFSQAIMSRSVALQKIMAVKFYTQKHEKRKEKALNHVFLVLPSVGDRVMCLRSERHSFGFCLNSFST